MRAVLLLLGFTYALNGGAAEATAPARTNILFCIMDDWGRGHAGAYGCPWVRTPHFDRIAREGLLFVNAYTPTAKCTPSRSAILTGRHPWLLGAAANHQCIFPPERATFPEILQQHGYTYASCGKVWAPGLALQANGEKRGMAGKLYNKRLATPPATGMTKTDYTANFVDFLADTKPSEPWFFWLGFHEPHRDYEKDSYQRLGKKLSDIDHVPAYWPDNATIRGDMLDYAAEVEHCDQHLGRILAELEKRGELDRTLIIITSDNGMPFPRVKGNTYEDANHLPLAIRWPAGIKNAGRKVTDYVNFVDFAPTFLDVAGIAWPTDGNLGASSGQSLRPLFQSGIAGRTDPRRDHTLIGRERNDFGRPGDVGYPVRGIVKDGLAYLENGEPTRWPAGNPETGYLDTDGGPTKSFILAARRQAGRDASWDYCFGLRPGSELYDLRADRDCVRNLASTQPEVVQNLRTQLWAELKAQGDLRANGRGAEYEAYPSADIKKRGFYERYLRGEKIDTNWVILSDFEPAPLK